MGKTRKHRMRFSTKDNPLGIVDLKDMEEGFLAEDEMNLTNPVEAVREQLLNTNIEEKLNGLQCLAVMAASKEKVVAICSSDIIRVAAPFLCEADQAVRNAAAGALRNLSVNGTEVCDYLVEQDVLTPLLTVLSEYSRDAQWKPSFDSTINDQIDLRSDVFLQAINLLWNLCESSSIALEFFNHSSLLEGLIKCLNFKVFGFDIAISVGQCLLIVSENNPKSWNIIYEHIDTFVPFLHISGGNEEIFLCTLVAGVLSNVPTIAAAYGPAILIALNETLKIDHQLSLSSFSVEEPVENNVEDNEDTMDEETDEAAFVRRRRQDMPTNVDIAARNLGYLIDAQRLAAEVITNLCSTDDEEWMDTEDADISESESIIDGDLIDNGSENLQRDEKLPIEFVEIIKSRGLIDKLWQRSQPISENIVYLLRAHNKNLLMKVKSLRISSLISLQNLCNKLTSNDLGGTNAIYNVWVDLGQQVFKGPQDLSILEPATSLMRSTLEHLKSNKELFSQLTKNDLQLMLNGVNNCRMAEIRANWLRMLGTLACLLSQEYVKMIISFIVDTCVNEEDIWTISEALDALMDIFSDNDWNQVVVDLKLLPILIDLERIFKAKMRQQRKELKERYPAVQTVRQNLSRFIKYIENESVKTNAK